MDYYYFFYIGILYKDLFFIRIRRDKLTWMCLYACLQESHKLKIKFITFATALFSCQVEKLTAVLRKIISFNAAYGKI